MPKKAFTDWACTQEYTDDEFDEDDDYENKSTSDDDSLQNNGPSNNQLP